MADSQEVTGQPAEEPGGAAPEKSDVDRLVGLVQTQQETIDYLVQYIERVEVQLNDRIDAVEQPQRQPQTYHPQQPQPVDWLTIDRDLEEVTRRELAEFVDYLVTRQGLAPQVRTCWFLHDAAVEELTAVWKARQVAFAPNADASMLSWFQDFVERSGFRLRRIFVKCRQGHVAQQIEWLTADDRVLLEKWIRGDQ